MLIKGWYQLIIIVCLEVTIKKADKEKEKECHRWILRYKIRITWILIILVKAKTWFDFNSERLD